MGERRSMRRRAPEELRAEPVGHRRRRGPGRDGAVAHGPQAGVLAEGQTETLRTPETRREAPDGARGPRPGDPPPPIGALDGAVPAGRLLCRVRRATVPSSSEKPK